MHDPTGPLILAETLTEWRARFIALDEMLAGIVRDFDQMLQDLPRDAVLELTPELAGVFIASIGAVMRTAEAMRGEIAKAVAK